MLSQCTCPNISTSLVPNNLMSRLYRSVSPMWMWLCQNAFCRRQRENCSLGDWLWHDAQADEHRMFHDSSGRFSSWSAPAAWLKPWSDSQRESAATVIVETYFTNHLSMSNLCACIQLVKGAEHPSILALHDTSFIISLRCVPRKFAFHVSRSCESFSLGHPKATLYINVASLFQAENDHHFLQVGCLIKAGFSSQKQLQELQNDLSNHNVADLLARGHLTIKRIMSHI